MSWTDGTGGRVSFERPAEKSIPLAQATVSGERWIPGIDTPGSYSTGESTRRHGGTPTPKAQISSRRVPERALRKRRYCLKACLDELERVRKERDDPILRGNALADAKGHLQALWELLEGVPDAEALEEMVNVLQIALCLDGPEPPPIEQLDAISSVLAKMHDDPDVSDQIANELTQELIEGGVDVFREIG